MPTLQVHLKGTPESKIHYALCGEQEVHILWVVAEHALSASEIRFGLRENLTIAEVTTLLTSLMKKSLLQREEVKDPFDKKIPSKIVFRRAYDKVISQNT